MSEVYFETVEKLDTKSLGYKQNLNSYNHLNLRDYESFAEASGLLEREDVFVLLPYLLKAESILEVGAGFGRAIDALISVVPTAEIMALEACPHMCQFMQKRYINNFNVRVFQSDFLQQKISRKFDFIGMFWTTLMSFSPQEQQACFHQASKLLLPKGKFAVDLFESSTRAPHRRLSKELKMVSTELLGHRFFFWAPTNQELFEMALKSGLKPYDQLRYQVNGVSRRFVIFEKA